MLWIFVTIVIPLILPVLAMLCLGLISSLREKANWIAPIKDGQLCWGAIGMILSGMYEVLFPVPTSGVDGEFRGFIIVAFAFLLIFSSLIAALGAIDPVPLPRPTGLSPLRHFGMMLGSMLLTLASAVLYTVVHFY